MAVITTFSTLKTAVADWLDRDDISAVGGPVDTWIALCEAQIYRDLRVRFMESDLSITIASGVAAIPADFLELKHAYVSGSPAVALQPKNADWIILKYPLRSSNGRPKFIAQQGDNFIFGPFPDSDYEIVGSYYAKPAALSTSNETNRLTTHAPDLLLNGALMQSLGFLGMDDRAQIWQSDYSEAFRRLMEADKRERFPMQSGLSVTPG